MYILVYHATCSLDRICACYSDRYIVIIRSFATSYLFIMYHNNNKFPQYFLLAKNTTNASITQSMFMF